MIEIVFFVLFGAYVYFSDGLSILKSKNEFKTIKATFSFSPPHSQRAASAVEPMMSLFRGGGVVKDLRPASPAPEGRP